MDKLRSERSQWFARLSILETENDKVIGNSLLSASFCTYAGGFSFTYRREIVHNNWFQDIQMRKIPVDPLYTLCNRNDVGSSVDAFDSTTQNSILLTNAIRYPLCIDPYGTASDYIKSKFQHSESYRILHFYDENFMDNLSSAISACECVIVDDIDDYIDPSLRNLLEKNFIRKNMHLTFAFRFKRT